MNRDIFSRHDYCILICAGLCLLCVSIFMCGCAGPPVKHSRTREQMGTFVTITFYASGARRADIAMESAFDEIDRVASIMSAYDPGSELNRLNESGWSGYEASDELFAVIERSVSISEMTGGAFDITVGPLVDEWKKAKSQDRAPGRSAFETAGRKVGYEKISLDGETKTISFGEPGMSVDLGAVAKGYAADCAMEALRRHGIESAIIDAGGDVLARGTKPGGEAWSVAVLDPRRHSEAATILEVRDAAVATSGDYRRFIESGGRKYSHIFDPRTGRPSDCVSATAIAPDATLADALSTAFCVMGPEEAVRGADGIADVEVLIIDNSGNTFSSEGFGDYYSQPVRGREAD